MGVVHKLSQEVIDYIVQSKQDEASLSCRKIAALVDAKFNLHVSKSSVSTILKKENLSSTVGRRSKTEMGEAQFKIPNSKKEQMRKAMQTLKKQPGTQLPKEIKPKADLKARLSQLRNKARIKKSKDVSVEEEKQIPKRIFKTKTEDEEIERKEVVLKDKNGKDKNLRGKELERQRTIFFAKQSDEYSDMGYIFLKAIQWSLGDKPFFSNILRKLTEYHFPDDDVYNEIYINGLMHNSEAVFKRFYTMDYLSNVDDKTIRFNETNKRIDWMNTALVSERSLIEYNNEIKQLFLEVGGCLITLEDGTELFVDALLENIGIQKKQIEPSIFINRAIANLSKYFISNTHMPYFFSLGEGQDSDLLKSFFGMFSNYFDKKISKISLLGIDGLEITQFSFIPSMHRSFAVGVWPDTNVFKLIEKQLKWHSKKSCYVAASDSVYQYVDLQMRMDQLGDDLPNDSLRAIAFWSQDQISPSGFILTNSQYLANDVLDNFILRWHSRMYETSHIKEAQKIDFTDIENKEIVNFSDIMNNFVNYFNKILKDNYISNLVDIKDINSLISTIYNSKGSVIVEEKVMYVYLKVGEECPYKDNIVQIMNIINTHQIQNFNEKLLVLRINNT
jgi:hypothetical protein